MEGSVPDQIWEQGGGQVGRVWIECRPGIWYIQGEEFYHNYIEDDCQLLSLPRENRFISVQSDQG